MLEMLFNRWRGTGVIFWKINGNTIYAVYWALLVGFFSGTWYWGLLFGGLYILGESFAWGKWVGYVSMRDRETYVPDKTRDYNNDDGNLRAGVAARGESGLSRVEVRCAEPVLHPRWAAEKNLFFSH